PFGTGPSTSSTVPTSAHRGHGSIELLSGVMSDEHARPVRLSTGLPETVLPPEPAERIQALEAALARPEAERRAAVAEVVARWPRFLDAWARLGELARDDVEAYAYFRVGYHRGLDALRANGWRGSGYCRWDHEG